MANTQSQERIQLVAETGDIRKAPLESSSSHTGPGSADSNSSAVVPSDSDSATSPHSAPSSSSPSSSSSSSFSCSSSSSLEDDGPSAFFESAQWTADGTTVLTYTSSNQICGYVLPTDLLDPRSSPLTLSPQTILRFSERTNAFAPSPNFSLSNPATNLILASTLDHPIQLFYLFPPASSTTTTPTASFTPYPISSYPLKASSRSETFLTATSLLWSAPGTHFIAGARDLLARYDLERPSEPLVRVPTIPSKRHLSKGGGVGMRGAISALSSQFPTDFSSSLVAAGTWSRWVGLYDFSASSPAVATWGIGGRNGIPAGGADGSIEGGNGITQTIWSPCGRYLLVSERRSTRGILVYDIRVTGTLLSNLCSLSSDGATMLGNDTNQRMTCDVYPSPGGGEGFEVWSGTDTGMVRVWEGVGTREGAHPPAWEWQAHSGDDYDALSSSENDGNTGKDDEPVNDNNDSTGNPERSRDKKSPTRSSKTATVGSTCLHPGGSVLATCSGSWGFFDEEDFKMEQKRKRNDKQGSKGKKQRKGGIDEGEKEKGNEELIDDGKSMDSSVVILENRGASEDAGAGERRDEENELVAAGYNITDNPSAPIEHGEARESKEAKGEEKESQNEEVADDSQNMDRTAPTTEDEEEKRQQAEEVDQEEDDSEDDSSDEDSSSSSDEEEDDDDISWMRRRYCESSLKIWVIK